MQKIKIHNKKLTKVAAFILEIILIANPLAVFAVGTVYDTDYNVRVSGNNISVYHYPFVNTDAPAPTAPPSSYANSFLYANYVDPTPGIPAVMGTDPDTGESYVITPAVPGIVATCQDSALDPNSVITSGTSPARGFCAGMLSCNNAVDLASIVDCSITNSCVAVNACAKAIADSYNTKIINALKKATDAKISSSDLDSTKANAAIESCGGDLACIDKVLTALQNDSSFASSNTSDPNAPLTVSSLSDLINSSNSSAADTGPINTAANDQGGLLGKTTGPKVDVTFNASSTGQVGSKMTANAVPSFFNNASDPKNLYFTWYLKRKGCDLKNSGVAVNDACNFDGDDKVTENDWKIAAAKIIVAGSFDKNEIKYNSANNSGFSNSEAGYEAIPAFSKKNSSGVNIGWRNGFLRDTADKLYENNDQDDAVANCYVQAPKSGRMYELRKVKTSYENACPNGSHRACVADQTAACNVFNVNPLYTENFAACAIASEDSDNEDVTCSFKDDAALKNFKATIACKDGKLPICVKDTYANLEFKDESQNVLGVIAATKPSDGSVVNNAKMCSAVAEPDPANPAFFLSNTEPIFTAIQEKCSTLQNGLIAGTKDEDGNTLITGNANLAPKCTFAKAENLCKHLFPVLPKEIKTADDKQAITGDGEFNLAEKEFWGADPTKASTTGNGKDEERAVGLGVDKFEWMFSTGDMVGVVVEGDATSPSEHANDASYQRMWAFSKGICTTLDEIEKSETAGITEKPEDANKNTRGFYIDGSKGILTAQVDLNDCLEENLLEPDAAGSAALKVQLVASPTNPTNDPSGKGDILNVTSSAANAQDSSGLLYKWSVQKSRDGSTSPIDTTSWIDITKPMENVGAFTAADVTGLGKKDLNINLNLQDPERIGSAMSLPYNGVFYLRVKLRITGSAADGSQDAEGITEPIRVKQQENQMLVYPAIAKDGGMLEIPTFNRSSQELCSDEQGKIACYVTKNQILGLEVPSGANGITNVSWKVNGIEMACNTSISSQCSDGGRILFFPIIGNVGEAVDVVATALNDKKESVEVSRHFVIGSAQLQIVSADNPSSYCSIDCINALNACPKYLGHYNSLDGSKSPDCSLKVWQTTEGKTVTLSAPGQSGFDWSIDGQIIAEYQNQNQIQILIDKTAGESYNIGLTTHLLPGGRSQLNNTRLALYKNWKVAPEEATEENQATDIQLDVVASSGQAIAKAKTGIFGASLITHLPEQLMFLLKISLTSVLMFLVTGLIFAIIPETLFKKEELN